MNTSTTSTTSQINVRRAHAWVEQDGCRVFVEYDAGFGLFGYESGYRACAPGYSSCPRWTADDAVREAVGFWQSAGCPASNGVGGREGSVEVSLDALVAARGVKS